MIYVVAFFALLFAVMILVLVARAEKPLVENAIAHWCEVLPHLTGTTTLFYELVQAKITEQKIPGVKMKVASWREGGIHTDKRNYLRIRRDGLIYDLCAGTVGSNFFVSSWFAEEPHTILEALSKQPIFGIPIGIFMRIFQPVTYYRMDSAAIFRGAVHNAVLEVIDEMTAIQGRPRLSEAQRAPIMRGLVGIKPRAALHV